MFLVHAIFSIFDGPGLWAEDSDLPTAGASRARGVTSHPFAAGDGSLQHLLPAQVEPAHLRLPSRGTAPVDSPYLIRAKPRRASAKELELRGWNVPVLWLEPRELTSTVLTDSAETSALADLMSTGHHGDYLAAPSVKYLRAVLEFADDLVRRGRVLPEVQWIDAGLANHNPESRWSPVLRGVDARRAAELRHAMPPGFRSAEGSEHQGQLFSSMLSLLVDAVVRQRTSHRSLVRLGSRSTTTATVAWAEALSQSNRLVHASENEMRQLDQALDVWDEYLHPAQPAANLVLHLSETESQFRLEFSLRSTIDPSLLVQSGQIWDEETSLAKWLGRPREVLLAELGKATRVYPPIREGLRSSKPTGVNLSAQQVAEFLRVGAEDLIAARFEVLLPSWHNAQTELKLKVSGAVRADSSAAETKFGLEEVLDFRWRLSLGDIELTNEEMTALANAKSSLVRLRGTWGTVDQTQLRRGLEFLANQENHSGTANELLQLAAGHSTAPLVLEEVSADGWLGSFLDGSASSKIVQVQPPARFAATLRDYQLRGLSWLNFLADLGLGACLADDMGLGKTVQLLALESLRREANNETGASLLVCPMSLIGNWEAEAKKFAPHLRLYVHHGSGRHQSSWDHVIANNDIVITTYSTLARDVETFVGHTWQRLIFDEAQAVKNRHSNVAKALRKIPAHHRIALTGTPVENRLNELYSLMDTLNPGLLGGPKEFRNRYELPIERYDDSEAARRLRSITEPYLLRRVKTDPSIAPDLPEKIEIDQFYNLSAEQASLYQAVLTEMMDRIENSSGIERRGLVLATMSKLKQVCNHPAQFLHDGSAVGARSGKVQELELLLEQVVAEGEKALCFTQYTEFAQMLLPHLATRFDADIFYLHGGVNRAKRTEIVNKFQSTDRPAIFLLSLKAGGTGLNLTSGNHVLHLDRWWNPAVENQATDRAFRIGQRRNVQVRKFICRGTLEERIDTMIRDKQALADLVVGDGEGWLTELSTDSLRELFALSEEAIGE